MVDSSEDPVLTQLRAIRADISELQGSLWEIKQRLAMLERAARDRSSSILAISQPQMPNSNSPRTV